MARLAPGLFLFPTAPTKKAVGQVFRFHLTDLTHQAEHGGKRG
jgi:hypothetical protein